MSGTQRKWRSCGRGLETAKKQSARNPGRGLPIGSLVLAVLTPAKRLEKEIPRSARDLGCGLPLGSLMLAALTPAKRLDFTKLYGTAVLLDNQGMKPRHPTHWEKSIKADYAAV